MIPHDYHLHSLFSGDNQTPMEAMCRAAIARGIPEICFTEHYDVNRNEPLRYQFPLAAWRAELERCRGLFAGRLAIRAGLELSEPHTDPGPVEKLLASYPFDMIIGSLHWLGDRIIFDPQYFDRPMDEAYGEYFEELERLTRYRGFDVLGHLDIVARVGFEVYGEYQPRRYEALIRPVLKNCIENEIALDINAGCVRRKLGQLTPPLEVLRWYVEMGGDRVVFSSDAHTPDVVGLNVDQAVAAARLAGLARCLQYERRQARFVDLPDPDGEGATRYG
jgi:histidinol-phosphatase (PHP family)